MSFYHALEGIICAVSREAHLRFHIAIGILISLFAYFYGISSAEWAILILNIAAVISAEIFNTAVEQAVNTATMEIKPSAKLAKDAAAGAVLVLAATSILVGFCLFGDFGRIGKTLTFIFTTPRVLIPCLVVGIGTVIFVIYGGKNAK